MRGARFLAILCMRDRNRVMYNHSNLNLRVAPDYRGRARSGAEVKQIICGVEQICSSRLAIREQIARLFDCVLQSSESLCNPFTLTAFFSVSNFCFTEKEFVCELVDQAIADQE